MTAKFLLPQHSMLWDAPTATLSFALASAVPRASAMPSPSHSTASEQGDLGGRDEGFTRAMMATGNMMGTEAEKNVMRAFVWRELFPKVKFLQPEDLSSTGIVSNMVRRHLNCKKHDWGVVWEKWAKKATVKTINEKRNGITQMIAKQEFKSK